MPENVNFPEPIEVDNYTYSCSQNSNGYCKHNRNICCYECDERNRCFLRCTMKNDGIGPENCGSSSLIWK